MTNIASQVCTLTRATRNQPCPICGNTDWCSTNEIIAICMVQPMGAIRETINGGWLHRLGSDPIIRRRPGVRTTFISPPTDPNRCGELAGRYCSAAWPALVEGFAATIGVSADSLDRLRVGWAFDIINRRGDRHQIFDAGDAMRSIGNRGWSFPMFDHQGNVVGVRIRMESGDKFSVPGGREGLFVPDGMTVNGNRLLVVEGATDTAAQLDIGFNVVGRPSCTGGTSHLVQYVLTHRPSELVVVSDADAPGRRGAESLACALLPYVPSLRVIEPPDGIKDSRAWKAVGATTAGIEQVINAAPVRKISIRKAVSNVAA